MGRDGETRGMDAATWLKSDSRLSLPPLKSQTVDIFDFLLHYLQVYTSTSKNLSNFHVWQKSIVVLRQVFVF